MTTKENTMNAAKNGDVLFDGSNILLVKEVNHWHNITSYLAYSQVYGIREYLISGSDVIIPATKEQRDLLFRKMKDAGYEWDIEKKELKKIGDNPAWSEKDEEFVFVNEYIYRFFLNIADSVDAGEIADRLTKDVVKDIEECADKNFNDSDIHLALTRVLLERL